MSAKQKAFIRAIANWNDSAHRLKSLLGRNPATISNDAFLAGWSACARAMQKPNKGRSCP